MRKIAYSLLAAALALVLACCGEDRDFNVISVEPMENIGGHPGEIDGHQYIDLGLPSGLLWATIDLGADVPYVEGKRYRWGADWIDEDYAFLINRPPQGLAQLDIVNDNGLLTKFYDVATIAWGPKWRMPTLAEFEELFACCDHAVVSINSMPVWRFTGPNGQSLCMAAMATAGYWTSKAEDRSYDNSCCMRWDDYWKLVKSGWRTGYCAVRAVTTGADCAVEPSPKPEIKVGEAVDLGLPSGLLWSNINIGSEGEGDSGWLFSWGETFAKEYFGDESLFDRDINGHYLRNDLEAMGVIDENGNLTAEFDAAAYWWGDGWRMATIDEWKELVDNCQIEGFNPFKLGDFSFIGPNGNRLFITFDPSKMGHNWNDYGKMYWTSTVSRDYYGDGALTIYEVFGISGWANRGSGCYVRAVKEGR